MKSSKIIGSKIFLENLDSKSISSEYPQWLNEPEVNQFLESRYTTHTLASVQSFIDQINCSSDSYLFGIFCQSTKKHIGNIKLGPIDRYACGVIGLLVGNKDYWGCGIATEAISLICDFAFDDLSLERVEAGCYDCNKASMKAFLKVGFKKEGHKRSSYIYNDQRVGAIIMGLLSNER